MPRLTHENYLLDPEAISAVLQLNGINKSTADAEAWISGHGAKREYFDTEKIETGDPQWPRTVNAPKLLDDLFADLSVETPLTYRKLVHSVALTDWLLEHKPEHLREVLDYVVGLVTPR